MGLDIFAISKIDFSRQIDENSYDPEESSIFLFRNDLLLGQSDGIEQGNYLHSGETLNFRAGSYSGYNRWREKLAFLIGRDIEDLHSEILKFTSRERNLNSVLDEHGSARIGIPFAELIFFSDCEGFIGPETSAKLYKDFQDNLEGAQEMDDHFLSVYNDFMAAFELASDGGCVIFC